MKFLLKGTDDDVREIYDKYDFDQDYEVYKYSQQVLIFNQSLIYLCLF